MVSMVSRVFATYDAQLDLRQIVLSMAFASVKLVAPKKYIDLALDNQIVNTLDFLFSPF